MKLATRGQQGPWRHWPLATGDDKDSHRPLVPSRRRGLQPRPDALREPDVRQPWKRRSSGGSIGGREDLMHPYLARQMSDFEFRKPLRGSNSGVHAEISTYPACLLTIILSLARRARRDKETQQFILVRATLRCNTLLQHFGGLPRRAEDELV